MAIIFHRIIKDNIFPAESFNPFISDNAIEFSKDGIAVVYAPNGVGKTSLANVLEEGAGKNLSFEYDGKTDDPNAFYVIEDQNSRNIIKGDAGEFFVGTKVRDIKYNEQWLDARYEAIRLELRKFLDARNIKLTGHHFADVCGRRNEKLGKYVSDLANRSSQGKKQKYSDFADLGLWADQQGEQPVIQYDKEKLGFFTAGYGKDGIVDKILELDIAKVTHVEEIRNVERHTDALRILGKFIDSHTCIVCDTEGIDPDALYKRKAEARKNIMSSLDKTTKNIVEGILKTIDDADPFGIKPALYALIESGDAGLFEGVCEELGAYYESMCNEFINELNVLYDSRVEYGIKEKDNLTEREFYWVYRKYLGLISNDTVEFTEDDEKFIRMAVADLMRKDISLKVVDGDNGKRLALYLDGGALLGQDRKYLPLSTGEQNFISLAFELLRAKRSKKRIIVLDDPISSFDSIYKNKVAYLIVSMLRNGNKKKQRCILLTHNIDLLRVLDAQIEGCFSLYIMGNGAHSENGFFFVSVAEKDMLLYASAVMKALRDELLPEDILDEEMYLISIVPFVRGVARIHGYDKSFERLSQIMHGTLTKSVNISAAYKWIITRRIKKETCQSACNGYVPHGRTMLTSDKVIKRIREWRISGCPDILNPGKYGLLNKALKHIASFMYLRMYAEKVLCSKFGIDGSDMLFGNICSKAMEKARTMYPSRSEEIMEWKAGLMSKKSLVNDFNHFGGSLSIFFPAIDVSDEVLQRESDSIEAILTAIENAS